MNTPRQGASYGIAYAYLTSGERITLPPVNEPQGTASPREYAARHGILPEWADLDLRGFLRERAGC